MIIADTGFWLALLDKKDNYHEAVNAFAPKINEPLITTLPVMTEVCYFLQNRCNPLKAVAFLNAQQQANMFQLFEIKDAHLQRMATLMTQYVDLPMDLADASLVLLAEELGHGRIVSTDQRDFYTYRWKNHQPFTNLLEVVL